MTTQAASAEDLVDLPPDQDEGSNDDSGQEGSGPPPQPSKREQELERRLTQQGRELAETRRTLNDTVQHLSTQVTTITENLSARDKRDAEDRERQREAYIETLPEPQRNAERVKLLTAEVKTLKQTLADGGAQPARTQPTPPSEDPDVAFMRNRLRVVVTRAQERFGVQITRDDVGSLPEEAWEDETTFHDALYDLAEKKAKARSGRSREGESDVADKDRGREPQETAEERTRRIVREEMTRGSSSPAAPRASRPPARKPTEDDVKEAVSTYDSTQGPRAGIKRLKEIREKLHS